MDDARTHAPWARRRLAAEFVKFGLVGVGGLFVDMGALWIALNPMGLPLLGGRVFSYLTAATFTWACNRTLTFATRAGGNLVVEWAKFLAVNAVGGLVNFLTYAAVAAGPSEIWPQVLLDYRPYIGVCLGSVAGMLINFFASKRFVFR